MNVIKLYVVVCLGVYACENNIQINSRMVVLLSPDIVLEYTHLLKRVTELSVIYSVWLKQTSTKSFTTNLKPNIEFVFHVEFVTNLTLQEFLMLS